MSNSDYTRQYRQASFVDRFYCNLCLFECAHEEDMIAHQKDQHPINSEPRVFIEK